MVREPLYQIILELVNYTRIKVLLKLLCVCLYIESVSICDDLNGMFVCLS